MQYEEENIEKVKEAMASMVTSIIIIDEVCNGIINHPELNLSTKDFAETLLSITSAPPQVLKEMNTTVYKMAKAAAEQVFTQGYLDKEPPKELV